MRRALRHLFTILSAISLPLCVATCVLWVRSYSRTYLLQRGEQMWTENYSISRGVMAHATRTVGTSPQVVFIRPVKPYGWTAGTYAPALDYSRGRMLGGFDISTVSDIQRGVLLSTSKQISLPAWFAAGATALLPGAWCLSWRKRRLRRCRSARGECLACGYDLRASSQEGRCPECGTLQLLDAQNWRR